MIYNPILDELYSAASGHGAYMNEHRRLPLVSSPLGPLSTCLIATEIGADRSAEVLSRKVDTIHNFVSKPGDEGRRSVMTKVGAGQVHSVRSTGSAALNLCHVAKGVVDVFWEIGCWEW